MGDHLIVLHSAVRACAGYSRHDAPSILMDGSSTARETEHGRAITDGFRVAMLACAALATAGGILAWLTIRDDVLEAEPKRRGEPPVTVSTHFSCDVAGPLLRPASEQGQPR